MTHQLSEQQIKTAVERGSRALFEYCRQRDIHYLITGVSGGLDSAVVLGFAEQTCKLSAEENFSLTSVGLIMPCESKPDAARLGREVIKKFNAEEIYIDLTWANKFVQENLLPTIDAQIKVILQRTNGAKALDDWEWSKKVASGNIKARLRMLCGTYHTARMLGGIVLSTDNLSEFWMAFWTLHGDVGDFNIIQHILKGTELYQVARYLDVPQEIITAKPDDGLGIAGGDEDQLGAPYPILDRIMIRLIQQGFDPDGSLDQLEKLPQVDGVPQDLVLRLAKRSLQGAFKRKGTVMLTRKELGLSEIAEIKV